MKKLTRLFVFLLVSYQGFSQEAGRLFIRNFSPLEYKASVQNWSAAQDGRGIMYFSNIDGMLEYDGVSWKVNRLPGLHDIHMGSNGKIYAALENDLGVFAPDNAGNLQYQSLKSRIPGGDRDISTVWQIHSQGKKIIFRTRQEIFILENDKIKVIEAETIFLNSISIGDTLLVRQDGKGLYSLEQDSLVLFDDNELFSGERVRSAIPISNKELLIIVQGKGVYIYSAAAKERLYKPVNFNKIDKFLTENPALCDIVLPGGDLAIGTITGGIIIFDREGRIKKLINKNSGLLDNTVNGLFTDSNGSLWAALDNGISLIYYNLPFSFYNEQNGLNGVTLCLYNYQNRIYAGTGQNLYVQNEHGNFETIRGTKGQNFYLKESKGTLLSAMNPGISIIKGNQAVQLPGTGQIPFLFLAEMNNDPDRLIAGAGDGIYLMKYSNSSWHLGNKIRGFDLPVYNAVTDSAGNIWVFTFVGFNRLRISNDRDSITLNKQYTQAEGLPPGNVFPSTLNSGEVVFSTDNGIFKYLPDKDIFVPHPEFSMLKGSAWPFVQLKNGDIWFEEFSGDGRYEKGVLKLRNGKYYDDKTSFYKFSDVPSYYICLAPDSSILFATSMGILWHYPDAGNTGEYHFNTLIRKVYSRDSLLYGGVSPDTARFQDVTGPDVRFLNNNLAFHFAATFYEDAEKNQYRFRLNGQDTAWSAWVSDTKKEYTNLREGRYNFEVKSMNQYKQTGSAASWSFRILPPWYRTWWAFTLYGIISVLVVWLIVKLNVRRLEKLKEQLEKTVAERTAQLKSTLDVVNSQKLEIETVHGQITDSINYAKYIQSAILPQKEILDSYLNDYFVYFRPRDIVSGDFYWATNLEGLTIIAAVDCTGHGVPGAFMSMLGAALLNEIVNKEYITHPGVILRRLRKEIIRSLHQRGETGELKDGMDISLCVIDFPGMRMQFAGANNPLYLVRKKNGEKITCNSSSESENHILYEIKGDRMPISIHDSMKDFTVHEIGLISEDLLYLFSDGYADQFGGTDGKKLHYKAFKKILLEQAGKSMEEQRLCLENTFSDWKGKLKQVDDVLVIGIRV